MMVTTTRSNGNLVLATGKVFSFPHIIPLLFCGGLPVSWVRVCTETIAKCWATFPMPFQIQFSGQKMHLRHTSTMQQCSYMYRIDKNVKRIMRKPRIADSCNKVEGSVLNYYTCGTLLVFLFLLTSNILPLTTSLPYYIVTGSCFYPFLFSHT